MIEELRDYLVRTKRYTEELADEIHDAYLDIGLEGIRKLARTMNDDKHDYEDEIVGDVKAWQIEVGEV